MLNNGNGLANTGLEGKQVISCANNKCDFCPNENQECVKIIAYGGHICMK